MNKNNAISIILLFFYWCLSIHVLAAADADVHAPMPGWTSSVSGSAQLNDYEKEIFVAQADLVRAESARRDKSNDDEILLELISLANLYQITGQFILAEPLQRRYVAVMENEIGSETPNMIVPLQDLGETYNAMGRYLQAESLYERSLKIMNNSFKPEHPGFPALLDGYATALLHMGKYDQAEFLFYQSISIRTKIKSPSVMSAKTFYKLADLYRSKKNYKIAEYLYDTSINIIEGDYGRNHRDVGYGLAGLALVYIDENKLNNAEGVMTEAVDILRMSLPEGHPDVAKSEILLAKVFVNKKKYEMARSLLNKSLLIIEERIGKDSPYVFLCRKMLVEMQNNLPVTR